LLFWAMHCLMYSPSISEPVVHYGPDNDSK
jgi:hypothetical protein